MASAEHTASLPPIIEDESDENMLPMFYQKELERKDYRSHEKSSPINEGNSEQINESALPYNSWKARNRMLTRSIDSGLSPDMVSRLGQSLENCHSVVSGRQPSDYGNMNSPTGGYSQDNISYQGHMGSRQEQAFANSSNAEPTRYLQAQQDGFKSQQMFDINFMQNTTPRMYARGIGRYPAGYTLNDSKSQFNPDGNHFQMQPTINNSYENSNISPASFKMNSSQKTPFNSHPFSPGYHLENHRIEKSSSCQNSCCQSNFAARNTYMDGMMSPSSPHLSRNNPNFHKNSVTSNHNSVPQKSPSCHCHHGLEVQKKKKDKIEKNRTKQINDLYRIVWLQNQQLIQLQNEVKKLIEYNVRNEERNQKISEQEQAAKKQSKSTKEKRMFNLQVIEENKNLMEKVSVGIMTSFIDTSVKKKGKNKDAKKKKDVEQSITDTSSESDTSSLTDTSSEEKVRRSADIRKKKGIKKYKSVKPNEESIALNGLEIPTFGEHMPSPDGSLHIDMQDYRSTSDSDKSSDSDSDEDTPAAVGWTFYDKVVTNISFCENSWELLMNCIILFKTQGKVNNMLNKSESESEESENEVRNITLEQLRNLGVSMEESPVSKRVTFDEAAYLRQQQKLFLGESDTSMKMNALALKYLQEDNICDEIPSKGIIDKTTNGPSNNTNLSVATLRYLEKYHLFPRGPSNSNEKNEKVKKKKDKKKEEKKTHKKKSRLNQQAGKILDITAIKKQPKLLPKTHSNKAI